MSKHTVTFIGDQNPRKKSKGPSNPETITVFGLTFELDEPTVIDFATSGAQAILRKLKANGHFTVEPVEPVAEAEVVEEFPAKKAHPLDHDGDGKKGGSKPKKGAKLAVVKPEADADGAASD